MALGLSRILPPERLAIVVNTGDDEQFHGLHVSPDLDTMTYTLSGLYNPETGWGIDGDSFETLQMLNRLGADTWFNLGSRDFAMHIRRTELLAQGSSLSQVTSQLTARLGIKHPIIPMSDQPVRTVLDTDAGTLSMQEYFVKRRAEPVVNSVNYVGAADARPSPGFASALEAASAIVICPSNPFLSVAPIVRRAWRSAPSWEGLRCAARPAKSCRNWERMCLRSEWRGNIAKSATCWRWTPRTRLWRTPLPPKGWRRR